jgi:PPM family protein phosphatase
VQNTRPNNLEQYQTPFMSLSGKIKFAEITDTGKVREHNEDAIGSNADVGLMVLADGMGGYNAGEVASGIAVQTISELATEGAMREERNERDPTTGFMRQTIVLRDAVARANKIIFQTAQSQTHCEGMGTTLVAAIFYDDKLSVAHVGDSRAYRLRGDRFEQLTLDHSLLQELVDRGFYSEEEAQRSTNRNYVTRALGVEPTVEVEVQEYDVLPDDVYLLCSDGLPDMVEDEDIHLTISTFNASLDVVGQQLVELANDHGGRDNVSVMMAQVMDSFPAKRSILQRLSKMFGS